jgi:hypothetical protein
MITILRIEHANCIGFGLCWLGVLEVDRVLGRKGLKVAVSLILRGSFPLLRMTVLLWRVIKAGFFTSLRSGRNDNFLRRCEE